MKQAIAVINGPNLNLLGTREPETYGSQSLEQIINSLKDHLNKSSFKLWDFQSNSEGELVTAIQKASKECMGLIINPAAYTHTSIAIRDAIVAVDIPTVEVHLSNIYQREKFRRFSYVSEVAIGVISGFGGFGYIIAADALVRYLHESSKK